VKPAPLVPHRLSEDMLYAPTPEHRDACAKQLRALRNEGIFTPPSLEGSVLYPFTGGGANWSGASFDPVRRLLVVPVNDLVHVLKLRKVSDDGLGEGRARPLRGIGLRNLWFLLTGRGTGLRYQTSPLGGRTTLQHDGLPCNQPPWGKLVAVDLDRGEIAWSASTSGGHDDPGWNNYGPALVTAGGLVFHGGTRHPVLRVHDTKTGERVATFPLPAGLHAGPISIRTRPDGPQLLIIAPGGHVGLGSPLGDYVIAYALPNEAAPAP
jgi:quinoprotein glucose dehydrogenase